MAYSRRGSSMPLSRECGTGRLTQRRGTCWLNTSLNMLLLSSNIYTDLVKVFNEKQFTEAELTKFESILESQACPLLISNNPNFIYDYIFAHIYLAMTTVDDSIQHRYTPIEVLAKHIIRMQNPKKRLLEAYIEGYYVTKSVPYILEILYGGTPLIKNIVFSTVPLRDPLYINYVLEAAAIRFGTSGKSNHVISYFRCYNSYYIFDSNDTAVHPFPYDIINSTIWKSKLIQMYTDKIINVTYSCYKPSLDTLLYRLNEELINLKALHEIILKIKSILNEQFRATSILAIINSKIQYLTRYDNTSYISEYDTLFELNKLVNSQIDKHNTIKTLNGIISARLYSLRNPTGIQTDFSEDLYNLDIRETILKPSSSRTSTESRQSSYTTVTAQSSDTRSLSQYSEASRSSAKSSQSSASVSRQPSSRSPPISVARQQSLDVPLEEEKNIIKIKKQIEYNRTALKIRITELQNITKKQTYQRRFRYDQFGNKIWYNTKQAYIQYLHNQIIQYKAIIETLEKQLKTHLKKK